MKDDYLASKLDDIRGTVPSSGEIAAYEEGGRLNCSKGYGESIGESVERTNSEVEEAISEGGDFQSGIALIRERTEEREVFSEVMEEDERAEEMEELGY